MYYVFVTQKTQVKIKWFAWVQFFPISIHFPIISPTFSLVSFTHFPKSVCMLLYCSCCMMPRRNREYDDTLAREFLPKTKTSAHFHIWRPIYTESSKNASEIKHKRVFSHVKSVIVGLGQFYRCTAIRGSLLIFSKSIANRFWA